ncbi:hypothetical protein DVH05_002686 [Phytophthora capsici]|nr:hypothetical protein DVH05_002686 [Phytophthora capsici]
MSWSYGHQHQRVSIYSFSSLAKKTTYRCSFYRRLPCRGRCELMAGANTFTNFVPHTCQTATIIQAAETNVQSQMEERVDVLAVTELSQTANEIWRRINSSSTWDVKVLWLLGSRESRSSHMCIGRNLAGNVPGRALEHPWHQPRHHQQNT